MDGDEPAYAGIPSPAGVPGAGRHDEWTVRLLDEHKPGVYGAARNANSQQATGAVEPND